MSSKKIISRREFINLTGKVTGGLALSSTLLPQVFALSEQALKTLKQGTGKESWLNTACRLCPDGCSITLRRIDGIPISLKGNSLSPVNRGGLCPAAYANLEILYHPDRFTTPLFRPEGLVRKKLEPTDWEGALNSVIGTINSLVKNGQAHKIAVINGDNSALMQEAWQNFMDLIETPNIYHENCSGLNDNSSFMINGVHEIPKLDLINSECIISLGSNFLEEDGAPVHFNQVYSQFKDLENITRNKLIYVGPRANITATSAHKWIPIKPDTWGTLALGIAHILVEAKVVDLEFLQRHAQGFSDWIDENGQKHLGFETQVRSDFHPKKVEDITGIPEAEIRDLADLIMTRTKCIVLTGSEAIRSPRGDLHQWAVHCLNLINGNIQQEGGWYFEGKESGQKSGAVKPYDGGKINLFKTDANHPLEKPSLDIFAKRVEGYAPYKIELLIINQANPVYLGENRVKWRAALKHIPRVIFIGDVPNETSAYADVILPANSALESWGLMEDIPTIPFKSATVQQPAINPMYNTRHNYDILYSLMSAVLPQANKYFAATNSKELVMQRIQNIYDRQKGSLFAEHKTHEWTQPYRLYERKNLNSTKKQFTSSILKTGGWWNPGGFDRIKLQDIPQTASGKFELLSSILTYFDGYSGDDSQIINDLLGRKGYPKNLQRYATTPGDDFPLTLISSFPNTNPFGQAVYSPSLLETVGVLREMYWESWVEIHPQTAHKYGVIDGEIIQLDSQVGQIKARARVRPIISPDVVYVPLGLGRENVGRFGSQVGSDSRILMAPQPEINTGNMIISGTPVRITIV